jgi:hypothetical protein
MAMHVPTRANEIRDRTIPLTARFVFCIVVTMPSHVL